MIDLQGYKSGKRIFKRSGLYWSDAFNYLEEKRNVAVDKIDVQFFTDDGKNAMPVDDIEDLKTIDEAQRWVNMAYGKVIKHEYKEVRYEN